MNSEKILCIYRSKIDIENVYGNTENVHPKILYFPKGKFGHKFWMTYSPYPKHISRYENPCIAVSEDLIHWDTPTGKENSCLDDLSYTHAEMLYNSDPTMVYNSREGCIEVWWRYVDDYKGVMILKRRKTYDGLYWKPTEEICEKNRKEQDYVSPSVLYEENYGYRVYYVHRRSVWCTFFFSTYSINQKIDINLDDELVIWHIDVIYYDGIYELLFVAYNKVDNNHTKMNLFLSKSVDGIHFDTPMRMLSYRDSPHYDDYGIYKSSLLKFDAMYVVLYSYFNRNDSVGLGMSVLIGDGYSRRDVNWAYWYDMCCNALNMCGWIRSKKLNDYDYHTFPWRAFFEIQRILNEYRPTSILELGLGECSKLLSQYADSAKANYVIIDEDIDWSRSFLHKRSDLFSNTKVNISPLVRAKRNGYDFKYCYFENFTKITRGVKFDFLIIHPSRKDKYPRVDIIKMIPEGLIEKSVIVIENINCPGAKIFYFDIVNLLHKNSFLCKEEYIPLPEHDACILQVQKEVE